MSKKNSKKNSGTNNNNRNSNFYRPPVDPPEMMNMDALAYLSDDDLERRYNYLNADKDKAAQQGADPYAWEVELAYVQRESKIRNSRRFAHERFVRSNPDASGYYYDDNTSDMSGANTAVA